MHTRRITQALSFVLALALIAGATAAETRRQYCQVSLEKLLPGDKAFVLHLGLTDGNVTAGFGTSPRLSKFPHQVDVSKLRFADGQLRGGIDVTLVPDPWTKFEQFGRRFRAEVDVRFASGAARGVYRAETDAGEVRGTVSGTLGDQPEGRTGRYDLRIFQALYRLTPEAGVGGQNVNYALDMILRFRARDGKVLWSRLQTPVPDYRPYTAAVEALDFEAKGFAFRATARSTVDYHKHKKNKHPQTEGYLHRLDGLRIGETVVGTATIQVGDLTGRRPFWGEMTDEPAPQADGNVAWMRLSGAMTGDKPILLHLALHTDGAIHGLAWAPGYNHQPHSVDASKLTLRDGRLRGPVVVSIVPDVYHSQDVYFDIPLQIDAKVQAGHIAGSFTGTDRKKKTRGGIVGEIRPKAPPAATQKTLRSLHLRFGYSMPGEKDKRHRHMEARIQLADGRVGQVGVTAPGDAQAAWVGDDAEIRLEGDKLTGTLQYHYQGQPDRGTYRFTFQAIVNGSKLFGYWRGYHNGKPILTKSSKLSGTLEAGSDQP
jgi:hypothetical protein